jgi:hypothetical protein
VKELYKVNGVKYFQKSGSTVDDMILVDDNGKEWTWMRFYDEIYNQ